MKKSAYVILDSLPMSIKILIIKLKINPLITLYKPLPNPLQTLWKEEREDEDEDEDEREEKFSPAGYKNPDNYSEEEKKKLASKILETLKNSNSFIEDIKRMGNYSTAKINIMLTQFVVELKAKEDIYKPLREIKGHFINWFKLKVKNG